MRVAIIGGKLQGTEAVYLATKADWEIVLIDKQDHLPAQGLCHQFKKIDVRQEGRFRNAVQDVDLIIPALEDREALHALNNHCRNLQIPFLFDEQAYHISSSKERSNRFFESINIDQPPPWPECGFPVVVKPSSASGSQDIRVLLDLDDYNSCKSKVERENASWVLQKFLDGPSYSLEVLGWNGKYSALQVLDLYVDENFDCKRVSAPSNLGVDLNAAFKKLSLKLARALKLNGIMDVEVILNDGRLYVLEIDARLPSQTPTVVYWSRGWNVLELLWKMRKGPIRLHQKKTKPRSVIYEHIRVMPQKLEIAGEHLMACNGPLHVATDFFGSDEAITNYVDGKIKWVATLIITESDCTTVQVKRDRVIASICKKFRIDYVHDSTVYPFGKENQ
jgi:pyrrolysine biosynthesis protein PylC